MRATRDHLLTFRPPPPPNTQQRVFARAARADGSLLPPKYCEHVYKTVRRPTRTISVRDSVGVELEEEGGREGGSEIRARQRKNVGLTALRFWGVRAYPPPSLSPHSRSAKCSSGLSTPSACRR